MTTIAIRTRVLIAALLPSTAVALTLALVFASVVSKDLDFAERQQALALAKQIASGAEFALFTQNIPALQALAEAARKDGNVRSVALIAADGSTVVHAGTPSREIRELPRAGNATGEIADNASRWIVQPIVPAGTPVENLFHDLRPEVAPAGVLGHVVVEFSRHGVAERKEQLLIVGLAAMLGGLVFGYLIAVYLSRGVTVPILRMFGTIERFRHGDLSARLQTSPTSPLHTLEDGINRMAQRIEESHDELERRIEAATAELRLKKEEAEKANTSKSRFLAAASHDLRQPIHSLRLFVGALSDEVGNQGRASLLLSRIRASLEAISTMFDSLLDISKLEAGVIEKHIEDFPIQPLLHRLELMFLPVAAERNLRFKVAPSSTWVRSDFALLDRLLQNLLSNAIKYTPRGRVLLGCRRRASGVSIEVWDTGSGIAPEHQHEVFEEFFQVDGSAQVGSKGMGLGLAIVRRISNLLQHPVRMKSRVGHGSMFAVTVPYGEPVVSPARLSASSLPVRQFDGLRVGV
ncbi:MAG TPA: ATP-binding protein, partial [Burkholderiales bacterium]